jgi:hypothetical protein
VSCRRRRAGALRYGALALLGAIAVPAAHAAAGTASFGIRPGHYDAGDPASRAYFKRTVAAGASFTDDVVVSNGGSTPVTLLVYPVDGLTGQTSGSVYANRGTPRRETGAWLRVGVGRLTVEPGTETTVGFTARVPAGALPGDHLAGIAFEDTNVATSTGRFQVRQVLREVVGVLIRVPGPAQPRLQLGRLSLQTLAGTRLGSVVVGMRNAGRLLCKPWLSVNLTSSALHEDIARQLDTILPGDTIAYPLVLRHGLGRATYAVRAKASCPQTTASADERIRLGSPLAGTGDRQPAAAATIVRVGSSGMATWMVAALASLTAIAGAGIGWMLRLRRSRP